MDALLRRYDKLLKGIATAEFALGFFCLFAIVVCIFLQVVSRYVFGRPLQWVEEFSTYCFIWAVYLGAAYALIKGRHIRVTTFVDSFPEAAQRVVSVLIYASLIFFLVVLLKTGVKQIAMERFQSTIALPVKLPRKFFFSYPFVISCASMLFTSFYLLLREIHGVFVRPRATAGTRPTPERSR